jgi:hypothetical protein
VKVAKQKGASVDQSVVEMRTELARKIADRAVAQGDALTGDTRSAPLPAFRSHRLHLGYIRAAPPARLYIKVDYLGPAESTLF